MATERTMTEAEASQDVDGLLRRVANGGETVIVELQGKPAIVFVSIAEYERLTGVPLPAERERVRLAEKRGGTP